VISADRISRRFGDRLAVEDVSFDVQPGEVFGLLGPNGTYRPRAWGLERR
jgi:ABC-2 type transport system ATP-binding protein